MNLEIRFFGVGTTNTHIYICMYHQTYVLISVVRVNVRNVMRKVIEVQ